MSPFIELTTAGGVALLYGKDIQEPVNPVVKIVLSKIRVRQVVICSKAAGFLMMMLCLAESRLPRSPRPGLPGSEDMEWR